ncbi:MAG: M3 family metallopeptidase [Gammaproteobacteria bacterium]|nr:M3 family metallopeptidase [Gammaproteobacteria bacterium]
MSHAKDNPLLNTSDLPRFSSIRAEHVVPALGAVLRENREELEELVSGEQVPTWDNLIRPLELMEERLDRVWSPVSHLNSVVNNPDLREAYNTCLADLSAYSTELGQNRRLYEAFMEIEKRERPGLDAARQKLLENSLRDFRLAGVHLDPEKKAQFKKAQQDLAALAARFEENVLDATNAFQRHITDEDMLAGLPDPTVARALAAAEEQGQQGWLLSLDYPNYHAVLSYADLGDLRREFYTAWATRASDQGPDAGRWDNSGVIEDTLRLRHEVARLLDYPNFAALSLATKMAKSTEQVMAFLEDLARRSRDIARLQVQELEALAGHRLEAWDLMYYAEKLKRERFQVSDEILKAYFPIEKVLDGIFQIAQRLYGIHLAPRDGVETWHEDVRYIDVLDDRGDPRGGLFIDLYARKNKRGGAWMDDCINRNGMKKPVQYPVAHLVCNFNPPTESHPSLLTHDDVVTLFHEFGHTLHHLLTVVDVPGVAGIHGVPWDAVELPSQFMENFAWQEEALPLISSHYRTGEPLPRTLFERLNGSRQFMGAMHMLRQLEFALFDMRVHSEYDPSLGGRVLEIIEQVRSEVSVLAPPAFNRFSHSFSHIFAGGYAAGYYSYKWAEVLAADAFSAFEEQGIFNSEVADRMRSRILSVGGSVDAMEAFVAFRGRAPSLEPLLRQTGIESNVAAA